MPSIKVSLGIGFANARHEDTLEIPEDEWMECVTEEDREELMNGYAADWAGNYIDIGYQLVEDKQ